MKRDGFISYSHKRDIELAQALQRGLHQLARPWTRRPVLSVFRDTTSLSANHDLWSSILNELEQTRYFIYLASPEAAESRWVRKEIQFWLDNRPLDRFLIAVSSGQVAWDQEAGDFDWERTDALPDLLRGRFTTEPLWVDLTRIREGSKYSLRQAEFRDAVGTLAAPLHGVGKDALDSEDIRQHRLSARLRRGAVSGLVVLLVTAVIASVLAWQQRNEALDRARTSASQALAARALETLDADPRKAAQFALYAEKVKPTADSAQALAATVAANGHVVRHLKPGSDEVSAYIGSRSSPPARVAISRDGGVLAYYAAFGSRKVHIYDIRTGQSRNPLPAQTQESVGGEFELSADGGILAVESGVNHVQLWDVRKARQLWAGSLGNNPKELSNAHKGFRSMALSPDGRWLAAAHATIGADSLQISIWSRAAGRVVHEELSGSQNVTLGFEETGRQLLALDEDAGSLRRYDTLRGTWGAARKLDGFQAKSDDVILAPGAGQAAVRSRDGEVQIWDLVTGKPIAGSGTGALDEIALPGAGVRFVAGARDGTVALYDRDLSRDRVLGAFSFPVQDLAVSGDGRWVAAGSDDGAISLFSADPLRAGAVLPNADGLKAKSLSTDGRVALRAVPDERVDVWTVGKGDAGLRRLMGIPKAVNFEESAVSVTADGSRAALLWEGELSLWDTRTGGQIGEPVFYGSSKSGFSGELFFLADDVHLVGIWEKGVLIIDSRTGRIRQTLSDESHYTLLVVSGDRRSVALLDRTAVEVNVWRLSEGGRMKRVRTAQLGVGSASNVSVSHGGDMVAVTQGDGRISFIDVESGRITNGAVLSQSGYGLLVFSRDTRLAAQAFSNRDGVGVRFWDTRSGDVLGTWPLKLRAPGTGVGPRAKWTYAEIDMQLAPAPEGGFLALGIDGSLVRRSLDPDVWRRDLCALAPEPLPKAEYERYLGDLAVDRPCPA
ncbi:TIR domain-containing protein [Streptomyces qinzhouensis]|uniref:TIR domain-containing protein n=1 Tax=Streptomyces qinzhouensis TaxID=2599401 RepID=A0A5B8IIF5_9ACTN|nr:TIR domain-containing protein [Streptomyces qinzhouensis]QDY78378.1 TIR domain-containing protein [Streptomyces qinzhouensis]